MLIGQQQIANWGGAFDTRGLGGKTGGDGSVLTETWAWLVGEVSKSDDWKLSLTPSHWQVAVVSLSRE